MIEIEKDGVYAPNIYETMYNLAVDVMDKVSILSSLDDQNWKENQFLFIEKESFNINVFESRMLSFKESKDDWDESIKCELIIVSPYSLSSKNIEKILPSSAVICVDEKYFGEEVDISSLANMNIFYYGKNHERFSRYFKKFGVVVKL